jgi:transmembrane sensor
VSNSASTESDIARLRDASEWLQRLNESNAQTLLDQWMQWCRSDPLNLPAFEQMQRIWNAFPEAKGADSISPQTAHRLKHRNGLIALAASVVLVVGMAGWLALRYSNVQVLDTAVGEQRRITLADGSRLDLAPDSRVRTRFTLAQRDVQLERGQAFFVVAHSPMRPFVVHVNSLTVTDIGTAFDVRIDPSSTMVTVSEGRVNVAQGTDDGGGSPRTNTEIVRASVGQRVTFSRSTRRLSVAAVDPRVAGSWRDGRLQFVGEPLEDVVGVVNRYCAPQIVVAPALQRTRFTGTVSPTHLRDWFKALEQIYAVEIVDQGDNGILVRSRTGDGIQK